jgi:hypothetical protein
MVFAGLSEQRLIASLFSTKRLAIIMETCWLRGTNWNVVPNCSSEIKWILVFCRDVSQIFALLGCYAALICSYLPTFRENLSAPFSRVKKTSEELNRLKTGILLVHEELCAFMVTAGRIVPRKGNVPDKSCRENQNTHFMFSNFFFFLSKIVPFRRQCGKIWWSRAGHRWQYNTVQWWITEDTDPLSEYAIFYLLLFNCNNGYASAPKRHVLLAVHCMPCNKIKTN